MAPTPNSSQSTQQPGSGPSHLQVSPSESGQPSTLRASPRRSEASKSAPAQMSSSGNSTPQQAIASNAKVAIPRQRSRVGPRYTRRVAKACESCRQRKTKCSGDTPICRQCRELAVRCRYPDGMREKTKRHMEQLAAKADDYESLLKEIRSTVDESMAERITTALSRNSTETEQNTTDHPSSSSRTPLDEAENEVDISSPSSIGSLDAIDRVEEDLNRGAEARATGFIGKNSEISWMQRLQREAKQRERGEPGPYEGEPASRQYHDFSLNAANYHLDDFDISIPGPVDMYQMPPREQADRFFEDYLTTVHPFYSIINRPLFTSQYKYFFDNSARPGDKWLAILNMIFAIAAKHAHLVQAPWRGDDPQDHLVYLTRARYLSMTGDVLFSHPDLQQVQVEGLIAFYLLSSDQINRAWRISCLAIRSAIALGINMKSSSETTTDISKESRYRVWWALYTFENLLGVMTGRATCILDGICTTPLPIPFEEERFHEPGVGQIMGNYALREERIQNVMASSYIRLMPWNPTGGKEAENSEKKARSAWLQSIPVNSGLLCLFYVDLTVIMQEVINKVYTSDAVKVPWSHIENRIAELKSRIDLWFAQLPDAFNFTRKESGSAEQVRAKLGLAFQYYSARITLGRPCLCRRDASSSKSNSFSHKMSLVSLEAAARMLDLIPDPPDPFQLYRLAPWWCILHYLMQSTTVLLLELSFGNVHAPEDEAQTLKSAKKAICWLYAMSEYSTASRRAWQLCDSCIRRVANGMKHLDISDLPPVPSGSLLQQQQRQHHLQIAKEMPSAHPPAVLVDSESPLDWSGIRMGQEPTTTTPVNQSQSQDHGQQPQLQQELLADLELRGPVSTAELATFPLNFPAAMVSPRGPPSLSDTHFPYDPISGEFMGSFFPNLEDDDDYWPT